MVTGADCWLVHVPTGIKVEASIPRGRYSRTEMQARKLVLTQELFPVLEQKVAAHLRIRGR
jgi:hypothetical protein